MLNLGERSTKKDIWNEDVKVMNFSLMEVESLKNLKKKKDQINEMLNFSNKNDLLEYSNIRRNLFTL